MNNKLSVAPPKSYVSSPPSYKIALPSKLLRKGQCNLAVDEPLWLYTGVEVIYVKVLEMFVTQIFHPECYEAVPLRQAVIDGSIE